MLSPYRLCIAFVYMTNTSNNMKSLACRLPVLGVTTRKADSSLVGLSRSRNFQRSPLRTECARGARC